MTERKRQQSRKTKRAAAMAAADEPVPADIDEFRRALARKIMTRLGLPRRCLDRRCRRMRRCTGADLRCQRDFPAPPMTAQQEAAALYAVQKALRRRFEESGEQG